MIEELGHVVTGIVTEKTDKKTYVQKSGITYEVNEPVDAEIGDTVQGFVYINRNDKYKMTVNPPEIQVGKYGWGEVIKSRRDLGVFVDIGLEDKDIVVSLDDLPLETHIWPDKGCKLYIELTVDNQNRMWGKIADESLIVAQSRRAKPENHNDDVTGVVYSTKVAGSYVLTDQKFLGFIHPNERPKEPRLGEEIEGRIIVVHPEGSVNISLFPRAHEVLEQDAALIYQVLKRSSGQKIPYTDKSKPEEIQNFFGISKGQFKRSVGRLMKMGIVKQEDGYTHLIREIETEEAEE